MKARTLLNLVLACVALLLVLVIFYQPGLEQQPLAPPITTIPVDSITRIQVTRQQRPALDFTKSATGWRLKQDQGLPASEFQLQSLLGILATRPDRSYPGSALDLASAGLQPAQATLLLDDTLINIGNTEPLENKRYIQHADSVYLVTDKYQHLINADWTNFVDRRLLPVDTTLSALQLPGLSLIRDDRQQWQLTPKDHDATSITVQALVTQWQTANASYIRRYDGAATNASSVTLKFADNSEPVTLEVIGQEPELILARPDWGIQYHFPANMHKKMFTLQATEKNADVVTRGRRETSRASP